MIRCEPRFVIVVVDARNVGPANRSSNSKVEPGKRRASVYQPLSRS